LNSKRHLSKNRRIALGVSIAAIILLTAYAFSTTIRPEWVFDGAYADYVAQGTLSQGVSFDYNVSLSVLAYNSTFAELSLHAKFATVSNSFENGSTIWVNFKSGPGINVLLPGTSPVRNYETNLTLSGRTVQVKAYEYVGSGNSVSTVFDNSALNFPVGWSFSLADGSPVDLRLVRTNIPGLMS
jgi:hypothetical protein